jgi:ribosomal protein S18 acetylase RimI-like enzyme
MSTVHFRRAVAADLAAIVGLLADDALGASREDASLPLDPRYAAAFAAIEEDPNQLLLVGEEGGTVVGCLQVTFIPGVTRKGMWRGTIEGVRVAGGRRGAGIGREMVLFAIARCRRRGCGLVQLTTDKSRADALRFYEDLGFVASHEGMKLAL